MEKLIEVTAWIFYIVAAAVVFIGVADWYKKRKN